MVVMAMVVAAASVAVMSAAVACAVFVASAAAAMALQRCSGCDFVSAVAAVMVREVAAGGGDNDNDSIDGSGCTVGVKSHESVLL